MKEYINLAASIVTIISGIFPILKKVRKETIKRIVIIGMISLGLWIGTLVPIEGLLDKILEEKTLRLLLLGDGIIVCILLGINAGILLTNRLKNSRRNLSARRSTTVDAIERHLVRLAISFGIVFMIATEWMMFSVSWDEVEMENDKETVGEEDQESGDWYYITCIFKPGIAMRMGPSDDAELVIRVPYATEFYVDTFSGTWGYTSIKGKSGWIEMKYAESTRNKEGAEHVKKIERNESDIDNWYYISDTYVDGIAVRSEPKDEANLLTRIPYGTEFRVETIYNGWGYTTVNGATGWIEMACVSAFTP